MFDLLISISHHMPPGNLALDLMILILYIYTYILLFHWVSTRTNFLDLFDEITVHVIASH